jgi:hypothetical protein
VCPLSRLSFEEGSDECELGVLPYGVVVPVPAGPEVRPPAGAPVNSALMLSVSLPVYRKS